MSPTIKEAKIKQLQILKSSAWRYIFRILSSVVM